MVKLIETYEFSPNFNVHFEMRPGDVPAAPSSEDYEDLAARVLVPDAPPEIKITEIRTPVSTRRIPKSVNIRYSSERNKKPIDVKRIPDFWTRDVIPLVSQKAKDLIEDHDPSVHQFFPVALHPHGADEPLSHTQFYFFANCRIIRVEPHETNAHGKRLVDETYPDVALHHYSMETLRRRKDLVEYLDRFPIWKLETGRRLQLASDLLIEAGQKAKLNGFQASDKRVTRHVRDI